MKQKKLKKKQKKTEINIAKQTLGNGHTVGFKSFMKLHHCNFCVYQPPYLKMNYYVQKIWSLGLNGFKLEWIICTNDN